MISNKTYYDIIPKFPTTNFLELIFSNNNKIEYFLKLKIGEQNKINKNYHLKTETEDDYIKNKKNLKDTNILLFLRNDIEYYLKLKNFNGNDLKYTTNSELEQFFKNNTLQQSIIELYFDRLRKKILKHDRDQNGKNLPYYTIIKNDFTNMILMSRTDYFIILPHNTCILTPNNLYLKNLPKQSSLPNYTSNYTLDCFYNENIDGIKITSIRHLGEIIRGNNSLKQEWITRFENLKLAINAIYKNNFDIVDIDKIFIYLRYPEYKTQSLKFYVSYFGDFMQSNNMFYYMSILIYLDDLIEYIRLSIETGVEILAIKDYSFFINKNNKDLQDEEWLKNKNKKKITNEKILNKEETDSITEIINENNVIENENSNILKILKEETEINEETDIGIEHKKINESIKNINGGDSLPLNVDINKISTIDKSQLREYEWYFIEIKINSDVGYGYDDIIFYGKYNGKQYCLEVKFKKQNIENLDNFYNLFSNYYIGFFEFELILKEKSEEMKITLFKKIKYNEEYVKKFNLKYDIQFNCIEKNISDLLYDGKLPEHMKKSKDLKLVKNNKENFSQFSDNCSLELLKLTLINYYDGNNELIYTCDDKLKTTIKCKDKYTDILHEKYISNIIFILDYVSYYKFNLTPTSGLVFSNVEDYDNYFRDLFNDILDKNNVIEYVGWFLYDDEFTFKQNITEVENTEYNLNYLKKIHNNIENCFKNFFKRLGFDIYVMIYYQFPSWISGLHSRILIIKDLNKFLFQKEMTYNIKNRYIYSYDVINLLNFKNINILKKFVFTSYITDEINIFYDKNKDKPACTKVVDDGSIVVEDNNEPCKKSIDDDNDDIAILENKKSFIGGNNNNKYDYKLKQWIINNINNNNINKLFYIDEISIDFSIYKNIENIENIEKIKIYNKWLTLKSRMRDTIGLIFRKLLINFFNINISEYINDRLYLSFSNKKIIENKLFIGKMWKIGNETNYFNITDSDRIIDFDIKYNNKFFNIITISNSVDIILKRDIVCQLLKKIIISLLWSLNHIYEDSIIILVIRDTVCPINQSLILLLSQFSNIYLSMDCLYTDPTAMSVKLIMTNIKNNEILIKHLEEILNFEECVLNLSFIKINKVVSGSLLEFEKKTKKITFLLFNRIFKYMESFEINKYVTNYPNISKENEELYLIKSLILFLIQDLYIETPYEDDYYIVFELMKKTKTKKILQIGMDNGNWSVFILTFFKFLYHESDELYKLISIDPNQIIEYKNMGIDNLKNLNLGKYHKLVDDYSYIYMQKSINKNKKYDIIFINEWITYDYTITDIFNSLKLLNTGGYLIIDGILNQSYLKIIEYIDNVYKHFIKINMDNKNIVIYSKIE